MGRRAWGRIALPVALALLLAGCGGMKVLDKPLPEDSPAGLAEAADTRVSLVLEKVIVRDGPGSWMRHAEWDEYVVRVRSLSDVPVQVSEVVLADPLGTRVIALADRGELLDATKETERRYETSGQLQRAVGGGWLVAAGIGIGAAGVGAAAASATIGLMSAATTGATAAGAVVLAPALVIAGAALAGAGVVRLVNNAEVNAEIKRRSSALPMTVGPHDERLHLFFPITPLPARLEIAYEQAGVRDRLGLDTGAALADLHRQRPPTLLTRVEPVYPGEAVKAGIERGWVKAKLGINEHGDVMHVEVLETSHARFFTRSAWEAFKWWKYDPGPDHREATEVMEF